MPCTAHKNINTNLVEEVLIECMLFPLLVQTILFPVLFTVWVEGLLVAVQLPLLLRLLLLLRVGYRHPCSEVGRLLRRWDGYSGAGTGTPELGRVLRSCDGYSGPGTSTPELGRVLRSLDGYSGARTGTQELGRVLRS